MDFKTGDWVYDLEYNETFQVTKADFHALNTVPARFRLATTEEVKAARAAVEGEAYLCPDVGCDVGERPSRDYGN